MKEYTTFPMPNGGFVRMYFESTTEEYEFLSDYLPNNEVACCLIHNEIIGYYYFDEFGLTFKTW